MVLVLFMLRNKKRTIVFALAGFMFFSPLQTIRAEDNAGEKALGGLSYYLQKYNSSVDSGESTLKLFSKELNIPDNIAVANVNDYVNIRENPGTKHTIVGILTKDAICYILEEPIDGWAHISSGGITGYISTDYLYIGAEAKIKAEEVAALTAEVTAGTVNLRSTPNTENTDNIIAEVTKGEKLEVIDALSKELITKNDPNADTWVKVNIDNLEGYVTREYVNIAYTWKYADKPTALTTSSLRNLIVMEAQKHLGLRYVWGGQSLTSGADCSGFVRAVYKKCGVNLSKLDRTSQGMASQSYGRSVSYSDLKPGDLVFYANSRGVVDHVAMYIGNGQVIHESGYKSGCKISKVNYRTPYKYKNFLD